MLLICVLGAAKTEFPPGSSERTGLNRRALEEWSACAVSSQMGASRFLRVLKLLEPQDTAGDDHSYVQQQRGFCQEMWGDHCKIPQSLKARAVRL